MLFITFCFGITVRGNSQENFEFLETFIMQEEFCIDLYSGKTICLQFPGKKMYVDSDVSIFLERILYLRSNAKDPNFHFLESDTAFYSFLAKADTVQTIALESTAVVKNQDEADLVFHVSSMYKSANGFDYAVLLIEDRQTGLDWIFKLKLKATEIVAYEITTLSA